MRICSVPGCGEKHNDHGLCSKHSSRLKRYGDVHFKPERVAYNFIDYTGKRVGKMVVIKKLDKDKHGVWQWECVCDCGNKCLKTSGALRITNSCGCATREATIKRNYKHGFAPRKGMTRFYRIWLCMKTRALNVNRKDAKNYIGRGITVAEEWKVFNNFYNDMFFLYLEHVKTFGEKETTLDRIDNNKGYFKDNCRWATLSEQAFNRRVWQNEK